MNFDKMLFERYFEDWSNLPSDKLLELLKIKSKEILSLDGLKEKLNKNKILNIKLGIDPTASEIHLGHVVPIMILNLFIKTGHHIDFIIGDFTAKIGDPSGRSSDRKALTDEEIKENLKTYTSQVAKYIDISRLTVHKNSQWLSKTNASELYEIFSHINLAQSLQRDDFRRRIENGGLSLAEVCYAILMGLDSKELNTDIEIGGIDQLLNFQQCKEVMKIFGKEPEVAVTVPILEGTSGDGRKMSKSFGNYIAVESPIDDKFGKIMSIPDNILVQYYIGFGYLFENELKELKDFIKQNPMEAKKQFATYLIAIETKNFEVGLSARENFERKFSKKDIVEEDMIKLATVAGTQLLTLLFESGKFESRSELRRLFQQKAIRDLDSGDIKSENDRIDRNQRIKVGKRLYFSIEL